MPLISVIVPAYNAEKTIKRCVDSIRRQTFSDVEILLIEDACWMPGLKDSLSERMPDTGCLPKTPGYPLREIRERA